MLPSDARDTGLRLRSWRLFVAADGDAAFLVREFTLDQLVAVMQQLDGPGIDL
jgi:hypothetical protein